MAAAGEHSRAEASSAPGVCGTSPARRRLAAPGFANACYFRSGAQPGHRKALIQITERCDLRCAHCFVSATREGADISLAQLTPAVIARLTDARVANVTITGGEPTVHPELLPILELFVAEQLEVTVCTNAVSLTPEHIDRMVQLGRVKVNVSIDGYSEESHGRFRGNRQSFHATLANTRRLASAGLLKGILSTPNALAEVDEYRQLYSLARELGIEYLLMNPLSSLGRGFRAKTRLRADERDMRAIEAEIAAERSLDEDPDVVFIRFPNDRRPLTRCIAGEVFYVFANGDTAICPYLVFAARNPGSQHRPEEFIVGNLFEDSDFAQRLDDSDFHERYSPGSNDTCTSCSMGSSCGKGCPAAVVANGGRLGELDSEVCPVVATSD
jgi:radical SAM protein with 4Fe4S-binding SPASM domain